MAKFTLDLKKAIEGVEEEAELVVRGTLLKLSSLIVEGTPVGNPSLWRNPPPKGYIGGTLRGSWNASISSPDFAKRGVKDKSGAGTIAKISTVVNGVDLGESFYLTNPQPYAARVEFGWSKQRPKGMVRVALAQVQQALDGARP